MLTLMQLRFGHPSAVRRFWRELARSELRRRSTPFYLFSLVPVQQALAELDDAFAGLRVRHWLSCKTQPLRPLLQWWRGQQRPIEVVSEFEFLAAIKEGFPPERILVNGPAKHHWLPRHAQRELRVNFDSVNETRALAPLARQLDWTVGVRLHTPGEYDPEDPQNPTQFGVERADLKRVVRQLQRHKVAARIVHFHLRTNVPSAGVYRQALIEAARMCREAGLAPEFVDSGGGFPAPHVLTREGRRIDAAFHLRAMADVYRRVPELFPSAREVWLENGRWLTARSGVLVIKILDAKQRRGVRHLICDGGRTMNALVSQWEVHEVLAVPQRTGRKVITTLAGPTCMAFDQLARRALPASLRVGDALIWLNAGAYHLSWETRFSHGLASVLWHDGQRIFQVRRPESFEAWWAARR